MHGTLSRHRKTRPQRQSDRHPDCRPGWRGIGRSACLASCRCRTSRYRVDLDACKRARTTCPRHRHQCPATLPHKPPTRGKESADDAANTRQPEMDDVRHIEILRREHQADVFAFHFLSCPIAVFIIRDTVSFSRPAGPCRMPPPASDKFFAGARRVDRTPCTIPALSIAGTRLR